MAGVHVLVTLATISAALGGLYTTDPEEIRRSLETEVAKNNVNYLTVKLVECLGESNQARARMSRSTDAVEYHERSPRRYRRKTQEELFELLAYDVDMSIIRNTEGYLKSRVVECRVANNNERQEEEERRLNVIDQLNIPPPVALQKPSASRMTQASHVMTSHPKQTTQRTTTSSTTTSTTTTTKQPTTVPTTTKPKTAPTSTTMKPTPRPTTPATIEKIVGRPRSFLIAGRTVSCDLASTRHTSLTEELLCRNIWVDGTMRLPNSDMCPLQYSPFNMRQLNTIQDTTFTVLDLKGLCRALGYASNLNGFVTNVKVSWDCDETKKRLMWLNDSWAGHVEDNGYLHDIHCFYSNMIT